MKRCFAILASLAVLVGAQASPNTTPVTPQEAAAAMPWVLYIAGSPAIHDMINIIMAPNCTHGSVTFFSNGSTVQTETCRVAEKNEWGFPENTIVVINMTNYGGDAYGVFPVAYNTLVPFVNLNGFVAQYESQAA